MVAEKCSAVVCPLYGATPPRETLPQSLTLGDSRLVRLDGETASGSSRDRAFARIRLGG